MVSLLHGRVMDTEMLEDVFPLIGVGMAES